MKKLLLILSMITSTIHAMDQQSTPRYSLQDTQQTNSNKSTADCCRTLAVCCIVVPPALLLGSFTGHLTAEFLKACFHASNDSHRS